MQNKHDLHLIYHGNDHQVIQLNNSKTGLERIFASELSHDIHFCRFIKKSEVIAFEVTIYGRNKREGDFKLIIEPAMLKKNDKEHQTILNSSYIIEPPCVWIGNPQRGIFRFIIKLENDTLLMKMDEDEHWFAVLYFPKMVDYYSVKMSLCKTIRSLSIGSYMDKIPISQISESKLTSIKYDSKKLSPVCSCSSRSSKK